MISVQYLFIDFASLRFQNKPQTIYAVCNAALYC